MSAHIYNVFDYLLETVNKVVIDLRLKITALLHDIGKPYKKTIINNIDSFKGHEEAVNLIGDELIPYLFYFQKAELLYYSEQLYKPLLSEMNEAKIIYEYK